MPSSLHQVDPSLATCTHIFRRARRPRLRPRAPMMRSRQIAPPVPVLHGTGGPDAGNASDQVSQVEAAPAQYHASKTRRMLRQHTCCRQREAARVPIPSRQRMEAVGGRCRHRLRRVAVGLPAELAVVPQPPAECGTLSRQCAAVVIAAGHGGKGTVMSHPHRHVGVDFGILLARRCQQRAAPAVPPRSQLPEAALPCAGEEDAQREGPISQHGSTRGMSSNCNHVARCNPCPPCRYSPKQ